MLYQQSLHKINKQAPGADTHLDGDKRQVRTKEREYRLATYLGGKAEVWRDGLLILSHGKYRLTAEVLQGCPQALRAPQRGNMERTCLLYTSFWAYLGTPLASLSAKIGFGEFKMKMSICSKMSALCNNSGCLSVLLNDKTSAGNSVPMKFIDSYMNAVPEIEPESFDICPILLTQPNKDLSLIHI